MNLSAVRVFVRDLPDAASAEQCLVGRFSGLSFDVADIHAERKRLGELGVDFSGEPEQQFWGGWPPSATRQATNCSSCKGPDEPFDENIFRACPRNR